MMIGVQRIRSKLAAGDRVLGIMVSHDSPWFVDMLALSGFDFIVLDAEHGCFNPTQAEVMLRAANAGGMSVMARVPNIPHEVQRYLDIGAEGILIPHVDSAAHARDAAQAMRYPDKGERGLTMITRVAGYGIGIKPADYICAANSQILCCPMIETAGGVAAIDEIAMTPGVDVIMIGSGDLAASMGLAGDRYHPTVQQACAQVAERARANGRWVAQSASDPETARQAFADGAHIVVSSPMGMVSSAGRDFVRRATDA